MANSIVRIKSGKSIAVTEGYTVKSSKISFDKFWLEPCQKEKADDKIFLYVLSFTKQGIKKIAIQTVDTDVVLWNICKKLHYYFIFNT